MYKRGISPVVATALLLTIALVLASIIFLWARSFLGEQEQKFDEPVENACLDVNFQAEALAGNQKINIVNRGNVPLYGIEVRRENKARGEISFVGTFRDGTNRDKTITKGASGSISALDSTGGQQLVVGEELLIQALVLGMKGTESVPHVCAQQSVRVKVNA